MIRSSRFLPLLLTAVTALLVTSCSGPKGYRPPPDGDAPHPRPVAMRGETSFFAGTLQVVATVTRGQPRPARGGDSGEEAHGGGGRRHGGHPGGGGMGGPSGGYAGEDGESRPMRQPHVGGPALTLRVKLTNVSQQPIDVLIHDVTSDLGNFAVRPEHLVVAPGQEAEVDPMVSELGVVAGEIPVTIVLRSQGTTETQVVAVKDTLASASK